MRIQHFRMDLIPKTYAPDYTVNWIEISWNDQHGKHRINIPCGVVIWWNKKYQYLSTCRNISGFWQGLEKMVFHILLTTLPLYYLHCGEDEAVKILSPFVREAVLDVLEVVGKQYLTNEG